ncbi:conserved hypothetical protein [Candida tropicalis MYA-3404]|uniref:Protein PAR32 n=1 Tax=Candida tropicalis (strain ATCC MYA-3404 / T1) TaxID=294747 RepID=C5MAU5_CANTT|nr:conserved hypothetical protein [Candida tropicalis MYA-3404]EER32762.1 conserved hypothetical protein [Candida tropicalis MYA-3404]KAG4406588.1 hypothetical protein JTP64_003972 [Candida tropicalis]
MTFATGRGGAGNIHSNKNKTSENNIIQPTKSRNSPTPQQSQDSNGLQKVTSHNSKKVYYSTGRGGAGNIQASDQLPSPKLAPQGSNTPYLHTAKVSTGRGGYGNMVDNKDPELTRKLQDVDGAPSSPKDDLYAVTSNRSFSVGRGGFGNMISRSRSTESPNEDVPNLYTVTSQPDKKAKKKQGFLGKIKEIFT